MRWAINIAPCSFYISLVNTLSPLQLIKPSPFSSNFQCLLLFFYALYRQMTTLSLAEIIVGGAFRRECLHLPNTKCLTPADILSAVAQFRQIYSLLLRTLHPPPVLLVPDPPLSQQMYPIIYPSSPLCIFNHATPSRIFIINLTHLQNFSLFK